MEMNYGYNEGNEILLDRKRLSHPNMIVCGASGAGREHAVAYEIRQVLDKTEDVVIILNDEGTIAGDALIKDQVTCVRPFAHDSKWHINPLDVQETPIRSLSDSFADVKKTAVSLIGEIVGRKLDSFEDDSVYRACDDVFKSFMETDLSAEKNPTLKDVVDKLLDETETREETRLANILKAAISDNQNEQNCRFAQKIDMFIERTLYHSSCMKLREELQQKKPYIDELFSFKTNMPTDRCVHLSTHDAPAPLFSACDAACLRYVWNRMAARENDEARIWFYQDEADVIFQKDSPAAQMLEYVCLYGVPQGGITTLVAQSYLDILHSSAGRVCLDTAGVCRFMNLSPDDQRIVIQYHGIDGQMARHLTNKAAGAGVLALPHDKWVPFTLNAPTKKKDRPFLEER